MAAGLYDITNETLGKGHFAVVKLAKHCLTGESVAVKIIDKARLNNEGLQQLGLEIRLLSRLSEHEHPNIVKLYQVIDTKNKLYLVMEYCGRNVCDLYDYIQKRNSGNGLKETEAKHIFKQICSAIAYCHSLRIVHRDLKPENILIATLTLEQSQTRTSNGKLPVVKLIDFGFSNQWDEGEKLRTSCGSLAYSAPEILLGTPGTFSSIKRLTGSLFLGDHYDGDKVDIWGLGCILYILLYGSNPFMQINDSETLIRILDCTFSTPPRPSVSEASISLIKALLKRDPTSRLTIHQILQHHWLNDNDCQLPTIAKCEPINETSKSSTYISTKGGQKTTTSLHENVIEQMLSQGMCSSRDQIERALNKTKQEKNVNNIVNGDRDSYAISQDNYITATYHLLRDKSLRESYNISQLNSNNYSQQQPSHHHKRILPSRPRKQLLQQPSRLRPGFIVEEDSDQQNDQFLFDSNSSSPQLETPVEDDKLFLPLARKCSIVSEEGSCAGTDYVGSDAGSERLTETDRFEYTGSFPSVDIVVTDCSGEEVKVDGIRDGEPQVEKADTAIATEAEQQEKPVNTNINANSCNNNNNTGTDRSRASLNSNLALMHLVSSSPELRDEDYEREIQRGERSHPTCPKSVIVSNEVDGDNDIVTAISHKHQQQYQKHHGHQPSATSLRVIVQSKSCNNILLNEEKSTKRSLKKKNQNESQNTSDTRVVCHKLFTKRGKHDRNDCCYIC